MSDVMGRGKNKTRAPLPTVTAPLPEPSQRATPAQMAAMTQMIVGLAQDLAKAREKPPGR